MSTIQDVRLTLEARIRSFHVAIITQALAAVIISIMYWPILPYTGLGLALVTMVGMVAARRPSRALFGIFLFLSCFAIGYSVWATLFIARNRMTNSILRTALSVWNIACHVLSAIETLRILRQMRIVKLMEETHSNFELEDLESQQEEEAANPSHADLPPQYHYAVAAPAPQAPSSPTPIYIAAPAYFPQHSEPSGQPIVPQFMPIFVDAAGRPIVPVQTQ